MNRILRGGLAAVLLLAAGASAQQAGSIRGVVYDDDFDVPLALPQVLVVETSQRVTGTEEGNYVITDVPPGTYTLVFSKDGYRRQVRGSVVVAPGGLAEVDVALAGEFMEMEEFVVQDLQLGGGTEIGLLQLRQESAALLDSISVELMSRAGVSDAASALTLVSGASVQDGKFAVIRGLPDRYVNSQINAIRLPTADADKRAVQLDQFPSAIIESIQVSKTFTPDQQGDASGGAVNVVLKSIPEQSGIEFKSQISYNTQVRRRDDFLTYRGGGVNFWGDDSNRDIPADPASIRAVGVTTDDAPIDYKWSVAGGLTHVFDTGVRIGGFASFFYERDSAFYNDGIDDSLWVDSPGEPLTPQYEQGTPTDGNFRTSLFDVTQGSELVQWGSLATIGVESEHHQINLVYLYTRVAEDTATLAEDTRSKQFFYPGYDPDDPTTPGHANRLGAPWLRLETLAYEERTTETVQLRGRHTLPLTEPGADGVITFLDPELDWSIANSTADLSEPDKRQFGTLWVPERVVIPGVLTLPEEHQPFTPAANFTVGNLQRTWKSIEEESDQYAVNLKLPFDQWSGDRGYIKLGLFDDSVTREYDQDSFGNYAEGFTSYPAPFDDFWSIVWPTEGHPITGGPPFVDVDYKGEQEISAHYWMLDLPVTSWLSFIGGVRYETTELSIANEPEADVTWIPPGAAGPVTLLPGQADVAFEQDDVLPSIGFVLKPFDKVTLRGSYSETVARQTFKELTPIQQQEFLGGDVFIGNPELQMSALENYDLRLDYTPHEGGLISASWFHKEIRDPIEYVQQNVGFTFTTPVNYPEGELTGWEFEVRQHLGAFWESLDGLSFGANATFIDSEVTLPADEAAGFSMPNIAAPIRTRDMTNAPEHLYNIYLTYNAPVTGTQIGLFYTVRGDTLIAGAGQSNGNFVPSLYASEFGTLNLTVTQPIGPHLKLHFQAKNLTDPDFEEVYRSKYVPGGDRTKSSYTKGIDYSIGLSAEFTF